MVVDRLWLPYFAPSERLWDFVYGQVMISDTLRVSTGYGFQKVESTWSAITGRAQSFTASAACFCTYQEGLGFRAAFRIWTGYVFRQVEV